MQPAFWVCLRQDVYVLCSAKPADNYHLTLLLASFLLIVLVLPSTTLLFWFTFTALILVVSAVFLIGQLHTASSNTNSRQAELADGL